MGQKYKWSVKNIQHQQTLVAKMQCLHLVLIDSHSSPGLSEMQSAIHSQNNYRCGAGVVTSEISDHRHQGVVGDHERQWQLQQASTDSACNRHANVNKGGTATQIIHRTIWLLDLICHAPLKIQFNTNNKRSHKQVMHKVLTVDGR